MSRWLLDKIFSYHRIVDMSPRTYSSIIGINFDFVAFYGYPFTKIYYFRCIFQYFHVKIALQIKVFDEECNINPFWSIKQECKQEKYICCITAVTYYRGYLLLKFVEISLISDL